MHDPGLILNNIIALYIGHTGYCIMLTNSYSGIQCLPSVNYQTNFFPLHILEMNHIMEINWQFMLISRPKLYHLAADD